MEWKEVRLRDIIDYKKGFSFKSSMYQQSGRYIVRVSDTTWDSINITSCNCIDEVLAQQVFYVGQSVIPPAPQETYMGSYQKKEKFADLFGGLKYLV